MIYPVGNVLVLQMLKPGSPGLHDTVNMLNNADIRNFVTATPGQYAEFKDGSGKIRLPLVGWVQVVRNNQTDIIGLVHTSEDRNPSSNDKSMYLATDIHDFLGYGDLTFDSHLETCTASNRKEAVASR